MKLHLGLALIIGAASSALGAQEYCNANYKPVGDKDVVLDLSKLNRAFTIKTEEQTPPSTQTNEVTINICDELQKPEDVKEEDFCDKGAYICRRSIITRKEQKIVSQIQSIAGEFEKDKLNPAFKAADSNQDLTKSGAQFSLVLNGGKYNDQAQSAQLTLQCDESQDRSKDPSDPTLNSYQNNVMSLTWKTVFACATKEGEAPPPPPPPPSDGESSEGMSGAGIFFTIVGVLLAVYFIGGAFYNFKMYNARGLDLIPHRDFWLDLPYLIKDLISHLVDSIMSHRRGSGGYVAV
ncbi:autophagy-related protein 27 [Zychaea mexicana]|uniref:autophagy-related protein 27 n=1 Tax=Zychaea mexicana TaxID=64656 RepID=UPI0022FEB081|nr:autophagy-related protein 27 [Zychaea mexicana]KAI9496127.1 autophagy-related protein 27 [Zychaea mexicana]